MREQKRAEIHEQKQAQFRATFQERAEDEQQDVEVQQIVQEAYNREKSRHRAKITHMNRVAAAADEGMKQACFERAVRSCRDAQVAEEENERSRKVSRRAIPKTRQPQSSQEGSGQQMVHRNVRGSGAASRAHWELGAAKKSIQRLAKVEWRDARVRTALKRSQKLVQLALLELKNVLESV